MLFSYKEFINSVANGDSANDQEVYNNWVNLQGTYHIEKEVFYKYLKKIKPIKYNVPKVCENSFNWDLLLRLIACSISSDYDFVLPDPERIDLAEDTDMLTPELIIIVKSGEITISKKISELYTSQILRLYEIYCSEQLNTFGIYYEGNIKHSEIHSELLEKINEFNEKAFIIYNQQKRSQVFL